METIAAYTAEFDAAALRAQQATAYAAAMDALLARYDAGETLTDAEMQALEAHFI